MKRVVHGEGGGIEVLHLVDAPVPQPAPGQVLIAVHYAGVNRPDLLQRAGSYPPPVGASPYLGLEVAGEIAAVGAGVSQWHVGDLVCALTPGGGYADYCCVAQGHCLPVPRGLSLLQASVLPETCFTVWTNVFERGRLAAGEQFLVHGGSSGIGMTAIQLAKAHGARVLTTVGNAQKAQACREAGADVVIQYHNEDFVAAVNKATGGHGVDVILDMVGGDYIVRNLKCLALEGRLVQIAFLQGSRVELNAMAIMLRRLTFTGSTLRARSDPEKARLAAAVRRHVWPLLEAGQCLPSIYKVFPLEEVQAAHALMESSQHIGKIALRMAAASKQRVPVANERAC